MNFISIAFSLHFSKARGPAVALHSFEFTTGQVHFYFHQVLGSSLKRAEKKLKIITKKRLWLGTIKLQLQLHLSCGVALFSA